MVSLETPLAGLRIVVTRAEGQSGEFARKLAGLGAEVIELPVISIRPPADTGPLDAAIARLGEYDWLIFTSANGVRHFGERLTASAAGLGAKICAIGPATRRAVEDLGWKVDLVPREYVAESLIEAFSGEDLGGKRILLPRAAVARDVVPEALRSRGALVDVVEAYRTVIPEDAASRASEIFGRVKPDWVTFTSSSTVRNFISAAGLAALAGVRVASIGPITSKTLADAGVAVDVEARIYTTGGLAEAIVGAARAEDPLRP